MLSSHFLKKNENIAFAATWMDLEIIILSQVSQTGEDEYNKISLICITTLVVMQIVQPLWRTVWRFLKKPGNRTAL